VHDEVLAGLAPLVGVVLAGEREGLDDPLAVDGLGDLVGVLLDDGEQVAQQLVLERREGAERRLGDALAVARGGAGGAVDRPVGGDGDLAVLPLRGGQAAARVLWLVRYDSPSSRRRW
jgi:hypothetical protein